jgi:acyl CoA:acetate/3-ketoacid CoA transferase beta subunit
MEHTPRGHAEAREAVLASAHRQRCVDIVITELCVLEMDHARRRFVLKEIAPGVTSDEVRATTEAEIIIPANVPTVVD